MGHSKNIRRSAGAAVLACVLLLALPSHALAYPWSRPLQEGDTGADVRALQVRVAGWYPGRKVHFTIDGNFGPSTTEAVKAFQTHYGLYPDGVAGASTQEVLESLQDDDTSTIHFDWSEFTQNRNSSCSAQANAYAGTFKGGMVAKRRVKMNVRRLMWRLEAIRAKGGDKAIGINSGFRSTAYNDCIGGARLSQHLYGTAADNRMVEVTNRYERYLAKHAQFHGVACYSSSTHNHLDMRMDNKHLPEAHHWYWPRRDEQGRDLADNGRPCWGESSGGSSTPSRATQSTIEAVASLVKGAGSMLPSLVEIRAFESAGEGMLNGDD